MNFAIDLLWIAAITSIRVSILHLYVAIFRNARFYCVAYVVMGVSSVCCVALIMSDFLICRPFALRLGKTIPGTCGDLVLRYITANVLNLILDLVILSMPMPLLSGLQIPFRKKLALYAIFGFGFG